MLSRSLQSCAQVGLRTGSPDTLIDLSYMVILEPSSHWRYVASLLPGCRNQGERKDGEQPTKARELRHGMRTVMYTSRKSRPTVRGVSEGMRDQVGKSVHLLLRRPPILLANRLLRTGIIFRFFFVLQYYF